MHNHRNEPEILCADHCHYDKHMVREEYPVCSPHSHLEHVVRHQVEHVLKNKTGHAIADGTSSKKFPTSEAVSAYVNEKLNGTTDKRQIRCKVGCGNGFGDISSLKEKIIEFGRSKSYDVSIDTKGKSLIIAIPENESFNQICSNGIEIAMEFIGNDGEYNIYKSVAKMLEHIVKFTIE